MPLANKYLRAIYACAREHGVSTDDLHYTIGLHYQLKSLKDLTAQQAVAMISGMRRAGRSYGKRQAMNSHGRKDEVKPRETEYMVTGAEMNLLLKECGKRRWTAETLKTFIQRQIKRDTIRTTADFNKVYWALKRMNERDPITTANNEGEQPA
jgi:ribosomal protein L31E